MPLFIFLCRNKSEVPSAYPAFYFSPALNRQRSAHHIEWQRIYCDERVLRHETLNVLFILDTNTAKSSARNMPSALW